MPKKRKALDLSADTLSSNKPGTPTSGPLNETQPTDPPLKKRLRRISLPSIPARELPGATDPNISSKTTDRVKGESNLDTASDDEINLLGPSPGKARTPPHPGSSNDELDMFGSSPHEGSVKYPTSQASTPNKYIAGKGTQGRTVEVVIKTPTSSSRSLQNVKAISTGSPSTTRQVRRRIRTVRSHQDSERFSESPPVSYTSRSSSPVPTPNASPSKQTSPTKPLPRLLPPHLEPYLQSQKSAILQSLQHPPLFLEDDDSNSSSTFNQLRELLDGTMQRNEGNSCLILGPRGSGKSRLIDRMLESIPSTSGTCPIVVRLSAHCQTNDRLAMREIARQVQLQVGYNTSLPTLPNGDKDSEGSVEAEDGRANVNLPPSSYLPMFISSLPALGRPVVVILDAFEGFAAHARQALLYCLLDTAQSCRGGVTAAEHGIENSLIDTSTGQIDGHVKDEVTLSGSAKVVKPQKAEEFRETTKGDHGLLVIGITSRVDCLTLLEKRVKSRFSHRVMRVKTLAMSDDYMRFARSVLSPNLEYLGDENDVWKALWTASIEKLFLEKDVYNVFKETFAFVRDLRMLCRLLISPVLELTPESPWLTATKLLSSVSIQRCPKRFPFLPTLPYPQVSLLIAAAHTQTCGHDTFNFEMLYDLFTTQVRTSAAAPVKIAGSGIGMMKVSRGIMVGAFDHLVATCVFQHVAAPVSHITREFVRYRCVAERDEIKAAVEYLGQTNLKKWFSKPQ